MPEGPGQRLAEAYPLSQMLRRLLAALPLLAATAAGAATYYVSPTGNDLNSGTLAAPWKTLARVNAASFAPGDVVLLQGGASFSGSLSFGANDAGDALSPVVLGSYGSGRAIILSGSGMGISVYNTAGFEIEHLEIRGNWNADTQSGNSGTGIDVFMDQNGAIKLEHIRITDVEVSGFRNGGITLSSWPQDHSKSGFKDVVISDVTIHDNGSAGISSWGYWSSNATQYAHSDLVIRDATVYRNRGIDGTNSNTGNGIVIADVDGALIERSEAYENGDLCDYNNGGPVGIWAWDATHVTIQFNESHHNRTGPGSLDGGGFDLDGGVTDSVVQYNYSHDNDGAGYLMWQFQGARPDLARNIVRYNVSENDGRAHGHQGIFVGGGTAIHDNHFHNNTIFMAPSDDNGTSAVDIRTIGTNNSFRNNLFVTTEGVRLVYSQSADPTKVIFQGNAYDAGPIASDFLIRWNSTSYASLASWRATGQEKLGATNTGLSVDAMLTAPGGGGTIGDPYNLDALTAYKLLADSPVIDQGLELQTLPPPPGITAGPHDYYEMSVPQGAGYDIGAHEFTACSQAPEAVGDSLRLVETPTGIRLTWSDVSGATSYAVYHDDEPDGSFDLLAGTAASGTVGLEIAGPAGSQVDYKVAAVNACGESAK